MYDCPYCGEPALSWKRKLYLGPSINVRCKSCGKTISISWKSMYMRHIIAVAFMWSIMADIEVITVFLLYVLIILLFAVIQLNFNLSHGRICDSC